MGNVVILKQNVPPWQLYNAVMYELVHHAMFCSIITQFKPSQATYPPFFCGRPGSDKQQHHMKNMQPCHSFEGAQQWCQHRGARQIKRRVVRENSWTLLQCKATWTLRVTVRCLPHDHHEERWKDCCRGNFSEQWSPSLALIWTTVEHFCITLEMNGSVTPSGLPGLHFIIPLEHEPSRTHRYCSIFF